MTTAKHSFRVVGMFVLMVHTLEAGLYSSTAADPPGMPTSQPIARIVPFTVTVASVPRIVGRLAFVAHIFSDGSYE